MRQQRRARGRARGDGNGPHPDEEALLALLDDPAAPEETRQHVAECAVCARRLAELRTVRRVLRAAAARESEPSRDLAREAVARARAHRATLGGLNELLAILSTVLRGLALLFAAHQPRRHSLGATQPAAGPGTRGGTRG